MEREYTKIKLEHKGIRVEIFYEENGTISHVINIENGKKMMMESAVSGVGYEIKHDTYLMPMDVCDARYIRIMDIDMFVPRLLFIERIKTDYKKHAERANKYMDEYLLNKKKDGRSEDINNISEEV